VSVHLSFDKAMEDVAKAYDHPQAVCDDSSLSREQKVRLLKQWEYDLRELQVASEENMTAPVTGEVGAMLQAVRQGLASLRAENDLELTGAAKHGG
jgi:hypothetical protein